MQNKILWYLSVAFLVMQSEICFANESAISCSDCTAFNEMIQIETKQMQPQKRYTIEMFNAIKPGMIYLQCAEILRSDGILEHESEDAYTGKSESWVWMNDDRSFIRLLFWNSRLQHKFQSGLR